MFPPGLGVPSCRVTKLSGGSTRIPWAVASRSFRSRVGACAAAARRRSCTSHGRLVVTQRPSTTGPATPRHAARTVIRGAPSRKASTAPSSVSISWLGSSTSRTTVMREEPDAGGSSTASTVLVPPTSPARITLLAALLEELRDDPGPARLVARPDAGAVVAVEVRVEEQEPPPVRVALEECAGAGNRTATIRSGQEDP